MMIIDAVILEPQMIEITETEFPGDGVEMKIGLIADFQRKNDDSRFVEQVVDVLNEQELDIVLIAGDFVHSNIDELPSVGAVTS